MPWITLIRLTDFPMVFALAIAYSQSHTFRDDLKSVVNATPIMWKMMLALIAIMVITLPFSKSIQDAVQKFMLAITNWFAVYLVACFFFRRKGRIELVVYILIGIMAVLSVLAFWEAHVKHILWANNIPSFLKIEDPSVLAMLRGSGTSIYKHLSRINDVWRPIGAR